MSGEINISVLLRFMAEEARRQMAGTSADLKSLGAAATDSGGKTSAAGQSFDRAGAAARSAAAGADAAGLSLANTTGEAANTAAQMGRAAVSTAGARDALAGLASANAAALQPVNVMTSAIGAQETAMQRAVAAYAGITGGAESAFAAQLRHGMMLDDLKARYNPLFAASRQYEMELRGIAEAEKLGALSAAEAAAARDRAAAALRPMPGLVGQYGAATGMAAGHTANLFAQWNDIALMMAAGQNPFQLALQQGTQVSQVLMMMGGGTRALKALGTSFLAMLNPISLATIGIIAFGAAGVQWLMSLGGETRGFDDELKDLNTTLGRTRTNLTLLADRRLEQKFGNMTGAVRELTQGMQDLDRAAQLRQFEAVFDKFLGEQTQESWTQWTKRSLGVGLTGAPDSAGGRLSAQMQQQAMAANYASLGAANSFADFQRRIAEISGLAAKGDVEGVTRQLAELQRVMTDGGQAEGLKQELHDLLAELSEAAKKTAEAEALRNGTARAAEIAQQTDRLVRGYTQQAQLAQAMALHGEHSAQVEELRARHAREALRIKLEEMGADAAGFEATRAWAALEVQLAAEADVARQRRKKDRQEVFDGLRREAELSEAILQFGADASEVEATRARHAREVLRARLQEKGWMPGMIADAIALTEAEQARQQAIKGVNALRDSNRELDRLRLEASLIGQSEQARRRALATWDAELEIRRQGLDVASATAEQLRRNAVLSADWRAEIDRVAEAWDRVGEAGERAIDGAIDRLTEGDWKGALSEIAQEIGDTFKTLALKNPLKNALLGTDYATLADVGGLGGIWDRLTGKAGPRAMQATSMAVTTPMVTLNAGGIAGFGAGLGAGSGARAGGGAMGFAAGAAPGSAGVQSQVWSFFARKGLAPHQIAAIMGNISAESAFNPFAVGDAGTSFGLFQHHGSRGQGLLSAGGGMGGLGDIGAQLEFAWRELLTSENGVLKRLMAAPDLHSATQAFVGFERPAGWSAGNPTAAMHWQQRLASAEAAMARFGETTAIATQDLGTFGAGAQQLGTGLQGFGSSIASLIQGIGAQRGIGGTVVGTLLTSIGSAIGIPGFAGGGATGGSDPSRVAGLVHEGEYVFDAAATSRIGVGNLEAIRAGAMRGYASGGYVRSATPMPMPAVPAAAAAGVSDSGGGQSERKVVFELNVSGTGNSEVRQGVEMAINAAFDTFTRDVLTDRVRMIVNDRWAS